MAKDKAPSSWITNYSSDGTNITIPIASLPGMTAAYAHATTGDIRLIVQGFLNAIDAKHASTAELTLATMRVNQDDYSFGVHFSRVLITPAVVTPAVPAVTVTPAVWGLADE